DGTLTNSSTINMQTTSSKIINGTTVLNNEGVINFQSTGFLYLYGDSTLNNALSGVVDFQDNASISYSGGGTFSFSNAGLLTKTNIAGITYIYPPTTNSGTIDVQSGEIEFIGSLGFTNTVDGIVKGIATIDLPTAANFTNDGTFAPGASPGILTVLGDFKSSSTSVLDLELEGLTQGTEYDLLAITGTNVIFDGSVNIAMGFEANIGDAFTVASTTGTITTKNLTSPVIAVYEGKQYTFDITYPGDNSVLLTISDKLDIEPPTVVTQNIIVQLDATGNASITADQIDNGSVDNCTLQENLIFALDITDFTCADLGNNTVSLTVTDEVGNSASADATVTVEDSISPTVTTQNITVQLDASGNASITTGQVDNGSSDNCSISSFSLDITDFTCADLGDNTVELTVTDQSGNSATASATVTVEDNITPTVVVQDVTVQLDGSGNASITTGDIDNGSTDNCSIANLSLDVTTFTCADLGDNTVSLTVTDEVGNSASADATVTVEDSISPTVTIQNITAQLDASGNATVTAGQIDNGSTDNCSISSMSLDITDFTCADLGDNTVELTVTDQSGNSASATATVTVEDTINPIVITQNLTVHLDTSGNATVTAGQIDNGSTDNCSISSMSLDITDFTCSDLGDNTVELTVTDQSGNSASATATVTLSDNTSPEIICPTDFTVSAPGGNYTVPNYFQEGDVVSSDNCDSDLDRVQLPVAGTVLGIGEHTITVEVTDDSGNSALCTFKVTVEDTLSIENIEFSENSIVLFPNPAAYKFTVKNNTNVKLVSAEIVDIKGSFIEKIDLSNNISDRTIETKNYSNGVYFVKINSEIGFIVKRLVISN
ncbi:MAG: HYR domain-containing protein, partial [Flavobacteriaceae bacterium]|nr:HYR domain-containing protein [Flavobacteriaceae bacterium]